jgi:hypothetical protein
MAYTALAYFADGRTASCSVRIKVLADTVGISEDTMKRGLAELAKKKAVRVTARKSKKSKGTSGAGIVQLPNQYTLVQLTEDDSF